MPKDTFFNLPVEKRQLITDLAIQEFYVYGFKSASISRMVKQADIAKGSFYQYFEGIEDLFGYIFSLAVSKKFTYFSDTVSKLEEAPFFEVIETIYHAALQFAVNHQKLSSVADQFMKSADQPMKEKILGENFQKSNEFIESLLVKAVHNHELRPDIHPSLMSEIITNLSIALGDHVRNQSLDRHLVNEAYYKHMVSQVMLLLKSGLTL